MNKVQHYVGNIGRHIIVLSTLLTLCACSSSPKVAAVKYEQRFDFSTVTQYSLYSRNHEFSEWQGISDALRNDIELAIERGLEQQGFAYSEVGAADIVMTYYLVGTSSSTLKRYNEKVNYCSYCLVHGFSGVRANRLSINAGDIIIDAIDTKTKRSVWRSSYPLHVKEKDNSQEVQTKVHRAISTMLANIKQPQLHRSD